MAPVRQKILIAGYYGFRNTGDEAILTAMLSELRALRPELEFVVVSGDPSATAAQYNVASVLFSDMASILEAARHSDLIVLGGGGVFHDYWGLHPEYLLTRDHAGIPFFSGFPLAAFLIEKPCMIYAVGVGPLFSDEAKQLTRLAFEAADVATVRDTESLELVRALGVQGDHVRTTADPSFGLTINEPGSQSGLRKVGIKETSRLVGVAMRNWDVKVAPDRWEGAVASALDRFGESHDISLVFIPFQNMLEPGLDDLSVAQRIATRMHAFQEITIIRDSLSPAEIAGILSQCNLVLGMRLHASLLSLRGGVPTVGLIYDPKVASLMARFGMTEYALDVHKLNPENLLEVMNRAWANKDQIRSNLQFKIEEMTRLAKENARIAADLLDRKAIRQGKLIEITFLRQFALKQTEQLAKKDVGIQVLTSQSTALQAQLAEKDRELQSMTSLAIGLQKEVPEKRQTIELLQMQLVAKQSELQRITSSLGWRLLSLYGPIKYRYLLPLYRFLHLAPNEPRSPVGKQVIVAPSSQVQQGELPQVSISTGKIVAERAPTAVSLGNRSHRDQLREVIARVEESKGAVIFLPSVGWKIHLAQRPHHIAREYARQGYVSIFVGNRLRDEENGFMEIEPNLFVFCSPEDLLREIPDPILWSFPYNFHERDQYPLSAGTVYDWIDDLDVFPYSRALLEKNHLKALKEATVVATVSRQLQERAVGTRPDSLYVPNGVEYERFADESSHVPDDPAIGRLRWEGKPIAGYYGAIAKWFDYDLLDAVAGLRPDWNFLLIGPMYDESFADKPILKRPNVVWIGPRKYETLPGYLRLFDVATIPFLLNDITQATSPLKLYEYFAGGKPVVTTALRECQSYPEVLIARDPQEFSCALDEARKNGQDPGFQKHLRTLARENSWEARIRIVTDLLQEKLLGQRTPCFSFMGQKGAPVPPTPENSPAPLDLSGSALEIAERFGHFRTSRNQRFFNALTLHLQGLSSSATLPMIFEFAITTNDRGRQVVRLLNKWENLRGKRCLDIGCAYGGFLVAFAERGAEPVGIDTDESLLALGRLNLRDNGIELPLVVRDATKETGLREFYDQFDIITCNDVVEHVTDRRALLRNVTAMLRKDGLAYFEIPNGRLPRFVLQDGHYQLFGITLLDYPEASQYYTSAGLPSEYDVYNYSTLEEYAKLFRQAGLEPILLKESFAGVDLISTLNAVAELRQDLDIHLEDVPAPLRTRVAEHLSRYLHDVETSPRGTATEQRDFLLRYGISFWKILAYKSSSDGPFARSQVRNEDHGTYVPATGEGLILSERTVGTRSSRGEESSPSQRGQTLSKIEIRQKASSIRFKPSSCYDVLCFPIIDWDFRFQRPQQILTQFARKGHRVFYLHTNFHQAGSSFLVRDIAENIYGIQLPRKSYLNLYREEINQETATDLLHALDELRLEARMREVVSLVQLPFWGPLALKARTHWGWKIIYDCMDEHSGFSTNNAAMLQHERDLISQSDMVLATSRLLYNKAARSNPHVLLLPNAADFAHFNRPGPLHPLSHLLRPIVGYYGAISDWFDIEMVHKAAEARPAWQFVLIGHTFGADVSSLKKLSNIHLLGEQPYPTLPSYLHEFDVACIPFLITSLTQATNPVKFYEYLSAGKPVVAVDLPELKPYQDYFYPVRSKADFVSQIEIAMNEQSADLVHARIEFARQNTWPDRFNKLSVAVQQLYGKVAIVIVSYDNPKCLRLCLESLWTRTIYPNFEVIVVDNGSGPELVEYLQASAKRNTRLKVILNGKNLGFARANNIGIRAAGECDYIVLLNDDTVLARGWLGKMVRYLRDDRVGIIGPVTNWIGNEAKIAVDYQSIADMEGFAERHMSEHEGRSFDIPMLAMFCIGMRKSLLDKIGLLDEQYGIGMFEDDDFTLRVREAGYRVVCAEDIFVHHWGQASFHKMGQKTYLRLFERNRKKFEKKWKKEWKPHQLRPDKATWDGGKFSIDA